MLSRRASLVRSAIQPAPNSLGKGGSGGAGEEKVGRWRRDVGFALGVGLGGGTLGLKEPASLPSSGFPLQQPAMPIWNTQRSIQLGFGKTLQFVAPCRVGSRLGCAGSRAAGWLRWLKDWTAESQVSPQPSGLQLGLLHCSGAANGA